MKTLKIILTDYINMPNYVMQQSPPHDAILLPNICF